MSDEDRLSRELSEAMMPLLRKAHELGYDLASFKLTKHSAAAALAVSQTVFGGCTTTCGIGPDGHMECKVHCP